MLERPGSGDRAILVGLDLGDPDHQESVAELKLLSASAGVTPLAMVGGRRDRPDPAYFAGSGKVMELERMAADLSADVVIFNHDLAPAQQRNLELRLRRRVIDRTSLILDIFAQRARSHEGKLQVVLAQLQHLATRLTHGWTHLERQKGGIGLRGPGETQLETDRRLIGVRVKALRGKLEKVRSRRNVQRRARTRANVFSVSLVGYTNAGKSTLFNALTGASAYAANQLFATLDPTARRVHLGEGRFVVLSDTVGFIRRLPHSLIAAFRATLEETLQADLLLHVVDGAHANRERQVAEVNKVLAEIGAGGIPQIMIQNKVDLLNRAAEIRRNECGNIETVWASGRTQQGLDLIRAALTEFGRPDIRLPAHAPAPAEIISTPESVACR